MQTSKTIKRILVIVLTVVFTLGGVFAMNFCLTTPSVTELYVHHVNELKDKGENVDLVFVGASRIYRGLNPEIFEEVLGFDHVLNNASSGQRSTFSYYMLEDMLDDFQPKYALIGTTYNGLMYTQNQHNYGLAVNRLDLINRIRCSTAIYGIKDGLMVMTGKGEYLDDDNFSKMGLYAKTKIKRYKGINDTKRPKFHENGFVEAFESLPQGSIDYGYGDDRTFKLENTVDDTLDYLEKAIQLCKDNGITPILFSGVCTAARMYSVPNYQEVNDFFNALADKYDAIYINMNYIKDRESLFPDTMFIDDQHVNNVGAELESRILANVLKDWMAGKDVSHYFYQNFDDMAKDVHRIPGCAGVTKIDNDRFYISMESVHNKNVVPEYRVVAYTADGDKVTLTDWTKKFEFGYSVERIKQYDKLKVEVRSGEAGEDYAYKKINLSKELEK